MTSIPANTEAEYAVIAGILANPRRMSQVADMLLSDHFHDNGHKTIYEAMTALHERGKLPTIINVLDELSDRQVLDHIVPPHTERPRQAVEFALEDYATSLKTIQTIFTDEVEKVIMGGTLNRVLAICQHGADMAYHRDPETLEWMEQALYEVATGANTKPSTPLSAAIDRYMEDYETRKQEQLEGNPGGVPTGFPEIDKILGGLRKSRLYTLFGSTGGGKTAFALNIAANIISHSRHVLFFSLEMDEDELVQRLLSMETQIDQAMLRDAKANDWEEKQIKAAAARLRKLDLKLDDRTYTLAAMRTKARALHRQKPLDLIVVDYLGLIETPGEKDNKQGQRYLEMGLLSKGLKRLSRELKVPILALGQLNRASEKADEPDIQHIYESGKIAQDSDVVMFAHVDTSQQELRSNSLPYRVNVIVRKHRNGRIGQAELMFRPRLTKFENGDWFPGGNENE